MLLKSTLSELLFLVLLLCGLLSNPAHTWGQVARFSVPAGLEDAVQFWKKIFTGYGSGEVVLFDPLDPNKIYSVLQAPDSEQGRALVEKERLRIIADYDLVNDETRIRSQRGAKENFLEGLKVSGRYLAQMQKIFRDEGLPAELAYLPLVESSFNIRARSSVGALGMWQFMPETGKKFMRIDSTIDERRDPMASTRGAARLLKENYRLFDNWPLAVTAYNHGTEGIFRGIKAVESDNLVDLIRRYQSPTFGFASKNFYAEFLAVVDIATNRNTHFPYLRTHRPVTLREVEVKRQAPLSAVLKPTSISSRDFFEWNPALEPKVQILPAGYRVKLPPDKVDEFLAAHKRISLMPAAKKAPVAATSRSTQASLKSRPAASATTSKIATRAVPISGATIKAKTSARKPTSAPSLKLSAR